MGNHPLLSQSINIHQFLEQDRATRLTERSARDRAIGRELARDGSIATDIHRILAWWHAIRAQHPDITQSAGERVSSVRSWLNVALVLTGLLIGASACSVALAYDGSHPVNLLAFLGIMVGLPVLLLLFTLISMLWKPAGLHLNSWLLGLWERMSGNAWQMGFGQSGARSRFAYWQVVFFSQVFSVAFFTGALLMLLVLVAVTDLAFGWSTTLQLEAAVVHGWFAAIAAPWSAVWLEAVPDLALVEASRFYRLEGDLGEAKVSLLGEWWPFVLMALGVWGLLPRLVMLVVCRWRLTSATRSLLREHSEITALLDRMSTPAVALGEDVHSVMPQQEAGAEVVRLQNLDDAQVVVWNDALDLANAQARLGSLLSETQLRDIINALPSQAARILVMVKAWEPPMLEVLDVLQLLRRHFGTSSSILVTPVGLAEQAFQPTAEDLQIWSAAVAQLRDPQTYVAEPEHGLITVERADG